MNRLFSNLRLTPRLALAFSCVVLVMALAASVGAWRLQQLGDIADELGGVAAERAVLARQLHGLVVISAFRAETLLLTNDEEFTARINADRKITSAESEAVRKRLDELTDADNQAYFDKIQATGDEFRKAREQFIQRRKGGEAITNQMVAGELRPKSDAYGAAVLALADRQKQRVDQSRELAATNRRQGQWLLMAGVVAGALFSAVLAWSLSRSITQPLERARGLARRVASGDLTSEVVPSGRDEVAQLMGELADMQNRLAHTVREVRSATEAIRTASSEIASGSADLSARTEQAASNLQQTAASMEQLTTTVRQSADSADDANTVAASATDRARQGGDVVRRVVERMADIQGNSTKINEIVGVIDGIAFQTNLLALNAAVEGARAGEQGRGFAVVASEVRQLAQRSAESAKGIKALIQVSGESVRQGADEAAAAGTTIAEVVGSVQQAHQLMSQLSHSAREQRDGIAQVNQAVAHLDQMTQQNAALVEQSSAASESLREQASRLSSLMEGFRLA
ncbi:methyl-accepting chemotaxis protein [Ideonella sp. DXS29W]|uniref:Methyl-accepting chemotaxis protein n=1 Tax=Ideonella lacteola TaxID=2984193 RepID=A0ABU9BY26_9BURK